MLKKKLKVIGWVILGLVVALILFRVIAGVVMQGRLNAKIEELRTRGEPVTLSELVPPEIPADQNAATLYVQAFQQMELLGDKVKKAVGDLASGPGPLTPEQLDEARGLLEQGKEALRLLREGTERLQCRFAVDYSVRPYDIQLGHLAKVAAGERLLALSVRVNLAEGKPEAAAEDCARMLALARSVHDEPILISTLVEIASTALSLKQLSAMMDTADVPADTLRKASAILGNIEDREQLARALRAERCMGLAMGGLATLDMGYLSELPPKLRPSFRGRVLGFLFKPLILHDGLYYLDLMDSQIELAKQGSWEGKARQAGLKAVEETLSKDRWRSPFFLALVIPALSRSQAVFEHGIARKGCAKLAIALRLYRMKNQAYPERLSQLTPEFIDKLPVDPFSGKDFVYRTEGKGFIVYSVGPNGVDDGGVEDPKNHDAGDIIWKCAR